MTTNTHTPRDPTVGGILKRCHQCQRFRDTEDLFESTRSRVCLLCKHKPALVAGRGTRNHPILPEQSLAAVTPPKQKIEPVEPAVPKITKTPSARRDQLEAEGHFPDEVAAIMDQEFPITFAPTHRRPEDAIRERLAAGDIDIATAMQLMKEATA